MSCEDTPSLYEITKNVSHSFSDNKQFSVGRSAECSLDIASKFISRNQCTIKYTERNQWAIIDLSSFRSTRVNGETFEDWKVLQHGDKISFKNYKGSEYIFNEPSSVPRAKKRKVEDSNWESDEENNTLSIKVNELEMKCNKLSEEREELTDENKKLKQQIETYREVLELTENSLEKVKTENSQLTLKIRGEQKTKEDMVVQMQDYIESLKDCELELVRVVNEKNLCMEEMSKKVESNNTSIKMRGEADSLLEPSAKQFQQYMNSLFGQLEFNEVKEQLDLKREELVAKNERLNEVIAEKELLSNNISDLMEQEFLCSVCSDLIFEAVSLECRHTFCAKCIATWKLKKKECPVCRTRIKAEVKPLIIDSFLDKVTDHLGGEFKNRRDLMRQERATSSRTAVGVRVSPYPSTSRRGQRRTNRRGGNRMSNRRSDYNQIGSREYEIARNHLQDFLEFDLTIDLTT